MAEKNSFGDFAGAMNALAEEKGIDKDELFSTVEVALAAAYKKEYGERGQNIRAELNATSGDMNFWLVKEVVDETTREFIEPEAETEEGEDKILSQAEDDTNTEEVKKEVKEVKEDVVEEDGEEVEKLPRYNAERDLILEEALGRDPEAKVGDTLEEELESHTDFGRVAAQTAKQVIIQRVRESEREAMFQEYKEKEGEIVNGTVQRVEGRTVFVDLGKSIGVLFPREQVRDERYDNGQRIKVYIESVELDPRGPGVKLSRVHPDMVRNLFEMEVPEIFAGTVELKSVSREAGSRSKIAVYTEDEDIDPVGSCVGQKGMRVNAVIDALGGEKIDIIQWSDDTEEYIAAALSPAQVISVELNEETNRARVVVPDDQLSLAIGKRGQNVRLAVKLTGWDLDVESLSGEDTQKEAPKKDVAAEDTTEEESMEEDKIPSQAEDDTTTDEEKEDAVEEDSEEKVEETKEEEVTDKKEKEEVEESKEEEEVTDKKEEK